MNKEKSPESFTDPAVHKKSAPRATLSSSFGLREVVLQYQRDLSASTEACRYLEERGLWQPKLLNRFEVGYAAGGLAEQANEAEKEILENLKIIREAGNEHFAGCITVPLRNEKYQPVGLYGRRVKGDGPTHLYRKESNQGLLHWRAYETYRDGLIWTESIFDALSLMVMGFDNVDAIFGSDGMSADHLQALQENGVREVTVALDNDEAGRRGANRVVQKLQGAGIRCRIAFPPESLGGNKIKDWNALLMAPGSLEGKKSLVEGVFSATMLEQG